jgi:hypothetical protein
VRWSERLLLFAASAVVLVAVDQVVKATVSTPLWAFHHRSFAWVALSIAVLAGAVLLTLVPSRAVAVAAGRECRRDRNLFPRVNGNRVRTRS